jgi:hypothetical protein
MMMILLVNRKTREFSQIQIEKIDLINYLLNIYLKEQIGGEIIPNM